ncbi:vancomycin high temperature exclusion protein [Algibacter sp. L1A34]|uniref:SanA/YdcF family protein n=1 Tax=Algibacter sp. L1A34 TaxID=2686365 RepID=UPI001E3847B5|nr:ElyC/SanA/YdcF family protein [Algibacter sp. L1A34]
MMYLKHLIKICGIAFIYIICVNIWVNYQAKNTLYDSISEIPKNRVGLILGASKYNSYGSINLYYKHRLEAAIDLYNSGKIKHILISGDNSRKNYDEPTDFKNDLISNGVPKNKIHLDYAGFRTLDSMVRAKEVFGLTEFTIISQKFHNERAIYLAKSYDIHAIAFNAKDVPNRYSFKTRIREYLARTKASIDLLFNVGPKFLGKKINIK